MTANRRFERELEAWLEAAAPLTAPADIHEAAIARAGHARQRPGWLIAMRGGGFGAGSRVGRPALRAAVLLAVLALVTVALAAAVVGALRSDLLRPQAGPQSVIAYSVFEDGGFAKGQSSTAHVMNADGTGDRVVSTGTCPAYSKDGSALAYRSNWNSPEVVVEPADGSSRRIVLAEDDSLHPSRRPYALSPDGTQVAWFKPLRDFTFFLPDGTSEGGTAKNELWVTPVVGGPGIRIVPESGVENESYWDPTWSPDGTRIAFQGHVAVSSADGQNYRSGVYVVRLDGSDPRLLTARPATRDWPGLSWSPDGRYLAYLGLPDGVPVPATASSNPPSTDPPLDIFVIGTDGTGDRNLTSTAAFERRPVWSPDGSRLAYETSEDAVTYRLAIVEMDGPAAASAPIRGPMSEQFAWSPAGTQLLSILANEIRRIDADFRLPPETLRHVGSPDEAFDFYVEVDCAPSWRSLQP